MIDKMVIGSEEWVSLPDLEIPAIKARVDSGAKTSAIHANNIQIFKKDTETWVSFEVYPLQENSRITKKCQSKVVDQRRIKNTSGVSEWRYVIGQTLTIGSFSFEVEITLTNRDSMGFRMLIGREAMKDRFVIDPSAGYFFPEPTSHELETFYPQPQRTNGSLKIALLASNPDLYSNRRLMEAAHQRGHEMMFLNIRHCYIKLDAVTPEVHYRGKSALVDLDAVIPRIRPSITYYGCSVVRQFETLGVYVQNSSQSIKKSRDKLLSSQLLMGAGLRVPTTGFANSPLDTDDLIHMVGGPPLVVKLLEGTQGKGVVLTETRKAAESVINAFKSLQANILVQEFIEEAQGKDIRCFVVDGKVVASFQRTAKPGEFRANMHQGGSASPIKITSEEKKMAVQACRALGLTVAGVDIIRSDRGPLILEVNSSPGLEGIEDCTGIDVAGKMIEALESKILGQFKHRLVGKLKVE